MRNRDMIIALLAGGLTLATTNLTAQSTDQTSPDKNTPGMGDSSQHYKAAQPAGATSGASDLKASSIIGLVVRNDSGERLGKVEDLIVRFDSHTVPFAIVAYGGALGIGDTRVAVPLTDLKWSSEPRELTLSATKQQFESASTTPTGAWLAVSSEDCLKNIDRFYGKPSFSSQSRYERQEATSMSEVRESVRNAATEKGSTSLMDQQAATSSTADTMSAKPADQQLVKQIRGVIRKDVGASANDIHVALKDGVVTLKGKVANDSQKQDLEKQINALPGVDRVEDNLQTSQ